MIRVLCLDDDPANVRVLMRTLPRVVRELGISEDSIQFTDAYDARDADRFSEIVETEDHLFLIADYDLGGDVTGLQILQRMIGSRVFQMARTCIAVVYSADPSGENRNAADRAAIAFFDKPRDLNQLLDRFAVFLRSVCAPAI